MANERCSDEDESIGSLQSSIGNWQNKQISTANIESRMITMDIFRLRANIILSIVLTARVGRWLPFYLRNKNHLVFCLSQCDPLRRTIYWKIISNYLIDIT